MATILIIDDDEAIQVALEILLSRRNYRDRRAECLSRIEDPIVQDRRSGSTGT